jgi:hypothetical protein
MNFLTPLAFAFAASLGVVILFYLLKRKRVVKLVPSTILWQKFIADTQANAPFQRLRRNWLLYLQLLLLALVVLALARPYFSGNAKNAALRIVILDASASMQSTDVKPSRFEAARAEALKWVDSLRDEDQMMVLLAGANTEVKQLPTHDKATLRRAINASMPADSRTRLAESLKIAGAFTFEKKGEEEVSAGEIHLFSDGAAPDLDALANKNLPIFYHRIGERSENAAVVTLDVRANPDNPAQRAIYTSVANFGSNAVQSEVELRFNDRLLDTKPVTIPPAQTVPLVFLASQERDGVFNVRLTATDDLPVDNTASVISLLPQPVKVLLVSPGNRFLERALRAVANVDLSTATVLAPGDEKGRDVIVLDGVVPIEWPPRANLLAIQVAPTNWFGITNTMRLEAPSLVDWRANHPLLRFAGFDNVQIAESLGVKVPDWGVSLLDAPQASLIVAGEPGRQRAVWLGFDPLRSTWPLRVSFPIFIANAVDWLNPASDTAAQLLLHPGDAFRLPLTRPIEHAEITLPDGTKRELPTDKDARELVFGDTTRQGVYRLMAGTNETAFAVSLLDSSESNTKPRDELRMGKYAKVEATKVQRANLELWRTLAAIGLAVLLFEWWYYHRRTV